MSATPAIIFSLLLALASNYPSKGPPKVLLPSCDCFLFCTNDASPFRKKTKKRPRTFSWKPMTVLRTYYWQVNAALCWTTLKCNTRLHSVLWWHIMYFVSTDLYNFNFTVTLMCHGKFISQWKTINWIIKDKKLHICLFHLCFSFNYDTVNA